LDEELERIRRKKLEDMKKMANEPKVDYPNSPLKVTDGTVDEEIGRYPLVLVDCWAEWCGPCRMVGPVIDDLAKEMAGRVVFGKLNVDENMKTSTKYGIMAIPTLLVFKDGKLIDQMVGAYPKNTLSNKIQKYL
jgi:thioredoxin 1